MTFVYSASTMDEFGFLRKSIETSGSSEKARMPCSSSLAASFSALLTSSVVVSFSTFHHHVDERDIRRRHAHGDAVELALQFRQHERDGFGRAGRSRNHRERGGARAAQILVRQIEQLLVVRVGVNRRHLRRADAEFFVDDFGDRREAVGRAGGVRDDVVLRGVVRVFVDAEHDGDVFVLGGRGDDDLFDRAAQVLACVFGFGEMARGFDDDFRADRFPVNRRRVFLGEDAKLVARRP